jgi:hypothetical protein
MTARAKAKLKNRIQNVQGKLERLKAKYAQWSPVDAKTVATWEKAIQTAKQQIEFSDHPLIQRVVKHHAQAVKDIEYLLLNDKELESDERRILMEKKDMYQAELQIFVVDERLVDFLEKTANANSTPTPVDYPQRALSGNPYVR